MNPNETSIRDQITQTFEKNLYISPIDLKQLVKPNYIFSYKRNKKDTCYTNSNEQIN